MVKACIRIALVLFLAAALFSQSTLVRAAGVLRQRYPVPSTATIQAKPVEVWSLTCTSTEVATGESDYSSGLDTMTYNYGQSGSTLYNIYADDTSDNANFQLHAADDYDATGTDVA